MNIPFLYSRCMFSFSAESPGFYLERELPNGGFETVMSKPEIPPFSVSGSSAGVSTYVVEANALLGQQRTPKFRINAWGTGMKLFDPVVYCRLGLLE